MNKNLNDKIFNLDIKMSLSLPYDIFPFPKDIRRKIWFEYLNLTDRTLFLHALGFKYKLNPRILYIPSSKGHTNVVHWLLSNGCSVDNKSIEKASYRGRIDVLEILLDSTNDIDSILCNERACYHATIAGKLDTLEWLIDKRFSFKYEDVSGISYTAALYGHLNIVQYVAEVTGYVNHLSFSTAISNGHIHILDFIYENDYDYDSVQIYDTDTAILSNNLKSLEWLYSKNFIFSEKAYYYAHPYPEITQWLKDHEIPMSETSKISIEQRNEIIAKSLARYENCKCCECDNCKGECGCHCYDCHCNFDPLDDAFSFVDNSESDSE